MISILGVVAEMERKLSKERQREGIELAKLDPTKYLGRKPGSNEGIRKPLHQSTFIKR
jgi:DNA invertase Pin-like site-specific DNA recombinase